jgi:D-alanyl-D-alanine carboxypeptidase
MAKRRCRSAAIAIFVSALLALPVMARPVYEAILLDVQTGQVLSELNGDVSTPPASLTKMMTLYLTFEALREERLRLDQTLPVFEAISVQDLILGIVTKSANDAAVVLAEALGGSEAGFARQMNSKAQQLGMNSTVYYNASGLPDPNQRTTARDIAQLGLALYRQFPEESRYFSTRIFVFRGQQLRNHNHLLDTYPGLDGIKTGFVNASGFDLAASAVRDGRRLIGVVMGGHSAAWRDRQMAALLDQGFAVTGIGQAAPHPAIASVQHSASLRAAARHRSTARARVRHRHG